MPRQVDWKAPNAIVPRPPAVSHCFSSKRSPSTGKSLPQQMQVSDKLFNKIRAAVEALAERHLDLDEGICSQPANMEIIRDKLQKQFPDLPHYKNGWPFTRIISRYKVERRRVKKPRVKKNKNALSSREFDLDGVKLEAMPTPELSPPPSAISGTSSGEKAYRTRQWEKTSYASFATQHAQGSDTMSSTSRCSASSSHSGLSSEDPIARFLQSLQAPVSSEVLDLLHAKGFQKFSDLQALALLPMRRVKPILHKYVETGELTDWEFSLIWMGLERMAAELKEDRLI
ncbi:hypothetical protein OBBRIDRAFT_788118 [Obba rivulosa]|uniref:Uncharacterized protein n=1 Tax=Obba rivulosa TaxID=1052685 RepID=A0A8E2DTT8_9APHY|nr:hypothetical protein OBBRIDRAFT_788118 [Obba rivulosa]